MNTDMDTGAITTTNTNTNTNKPKKKKTKTDKIDCLIEINAKMLLQMQGQQAYMQDQMQTHQKEINDLIELNMQILENTQKMAKHIDFINKAYEKISKSYFFKNLLG
jgi:hypothetical protein